MELISIASKAFIILVVNILKVTIFPRVKKFPSANPYKIYIEVITKYDSDIILIYNEEFISIFLYSFKTFYILKIYFYISFILVY